MRIIKFFLVAFILFSLTIAGFATAIYFGHADRLLTNVASSYLRLKGYPVKIHKLSYYKHKLSIDNVIVRFPRNYVKLHNLHTDFIFNLTSLGFTSKTHIDEILLHNEKNQIAAVSSLDSENNLKLLGVAEHSWQLSNFVVHTPSLKNSMSKAKFYVLNKKKNKSIIFDIELSEGSFLKGSYEMMEKSAIKARVQGKKIPLEVCQLAQALFPSNRLAKYLGETVLGGEIMDFDLHANIGPKFFKTRNLPKDSLSIDFHTRDVVYQANPDIPPVQKIMITGQTRDSVTTLNLDNATIADFDFSGSTVEIDTLKSTKGIVHVKGDGAGATAALTAFIPTPIREKLISSGIDLSKFRGNATATVNLNIPLDISIPPVLDIRAQMADGNLSVFGNKINLTEATLEGKFLNGRLNINGKGKINSYASDINFELDLSKDSKKEHKLTIDSLVKKYKFTDPDRDQKLAFLSVLGGSAKVHFEQFSKDGTNYFSLYSDLTAIDLYFDKLGIHKKRGESASIQSAGNLIDCDNCSIDFNVSGDNSLSIIGNIHQEKNKLIIDIPKLEHSSTKVQAKIILKDTKITTHLKGDILDLSDAKMLQFLEKERENNKGKTYLNASVNRVKLKNNIWLDNLALYIKCDETRCFDGNINAFIGKRAINMDLSADGNEEEWKISSTNAGATLKGLGAYDSMKAGNLILNIRTSRKEVRPGEIIPVHHGKFQFEKFVLSDAPAITRIVSFVSLPGFINMITNNKDLIFANMSGEFSFDKGTLNIQNARADGPFFDFTIKGDINIKQRQIDINGHVTPELYGVSSIVKYVPLFGNLITGSKNSRGIISAPYSLQQSY